MTIPADRQRAERRIVLIGMLNQVGEDEVRHWKFKPGEDFADVKPSTWRELADDGLIDIAEQGFQGHILYRMNPYGWLKALDLAGQLETEALRARGQQLMALLKGKADEAEGPQDDVLFDCDEDVPPESGLPPGWVSNAITSGLLTRLFPSHRINVRGVAEHPDKLFVVPPNFGRKLVDHD
jgi:hypothetical protein